MVCLELNPNLLFADCCSVEVVNGASGFFSTSLDSTFVIL